MTKFTTLREEFESETGAHAFADQKYIKWLEEVVEKERAVKNCSIPDVAGMFTKEMVINILQKTADTAFKNQSYEKRKIAEAIYIIKTLIPPSDFPDG